MSVYSIYNCQTKHPYLPCKCANVDGSCRANECVADRDKKLKTIKMEPKGEDGIYLQMFCVKDGVRYDGGSINLRDASQILTQSLLDGIEKLFNTSMPIK